ncbi:hypothetical protein RHMOL_Rhmol11G0066400 [Rhododendron molle]|uniref:Uncharacterized protein n=1 Tax=Rhododendron molle TaxID=49168 RepID=A0ACC0LPN2_RHOML|nr:hypothetical protein RHMOL_Rhmol11G0066400 [Rhododendron molle]
MATRLVEDPDFVASVLAEKRDFKRVQQNTPISVEKDPWFLGMFPILYAFHEFFGVLPQCKTLRLEMRREKSVAMRTPMKGISRRTRS